MAGFVFLLGSISFGVKREIERIEALETAVLTGVYSSRGINPIEKSATRYWSSATAPTLGDYLSMKPGDNVYFFTGRRIYGVGVMKSIGDDCKYNNYPDNHIPEVGDYHAIKDYLLVDFGEDSSAGYRWICTFEPSPAFYKDGIDMDEVLQYRPDSFKALRTIEKRSFIKIDDEENSALKELILVKASFKKEDGQEQTILPFSDQTHCSIMQKLEASGEDSVKYRLSAAPWIKDKLNDGVVDSEALIEASLIEGLTNDLLPILGSWDYITHQLIASPFKPIIYISRMDIFGYRFLTTTDDDGIIEKFYIIEIKKDTASSDTVKQIMKYVDWVCSEYANGRYYMVEAIIIAKRIDKEALLEKELETACRNYIFDTNPAITETWNNLRFLTYEYRPDGSGPILSEIE